MTETQSRGIDTLLLEERRYPPDESFAKVVNAQAELYEQSLDEFWEREGRERVEWFEPFTQLYEWEPPYAKWFLGGKLNVCFNCVDRRRGELRARRYDHAADPAVVAEIKQRAVTEQSEE